MLGMWVLNRYLPRIPGTRGLLLPPAPASAPMFQPPGASSEGLFVTDSQGVVRLGDCGRSLTKLRPAGKAQINGRRVDVIAQGEMIEAGRPVEVVEIEGHRIVVREVARA